MAARPAAVRRRSAAWRSAMATTTATTAQFNVGGILLNQPFKIRRLGHFGFNSEKIDETLRFYTDLLGFRISDEIDFARHLPDPSALAGLGETRGFFTRYGGDHH